MESTEKWLPVVGYEGIYEVSDHGRVKSLARHDSRGNPIPERIRANKPRAATGYVHITLSKGGRSAGKFVHTLVLEAFVGPRPTGFVTCHGNGIRDDNRLVNLRWDSPHENNLDTLRHGRHRQANRTHCPLGHPHAGYNVAVSGGKRSCLACARERSRAHRERRNFDPVRAHERYELIVTGREARVLSGPSKSSCMRGHSLEGNNLMVHGDGKRQCKACSRERANSRNSRRAFDSSRADASYRRIMSA